MITSNFSGKSGLQAKKLLQISYKKCSGRVKIIEIPGVFLYYLIHYAIVQILHSNIIELYCIEM